MVLRSIVNILYSLWYQTGAVILQTIMQILDAREWTIYVWKDY